MQHGFNWLSLIPGYSGEIIHETGHILMTTIIMVIILIAAFIARLQLASAQKEAHEGLAAESKLTFRNLFEIIAEKIYDLAEGVMGKHDAEQHFGLIATLFIFIFVSNFLGLVPGIAPPTDNLNTTLALGTFVFVYYNYVGFKSNGVGYLKHFLGPVLWLAPLMLVVELASHIFRPISLALRLRGNIMGDHILLGIFNHLTPYVIPLVFYGLGLFVALVQSFVFCLMTMVYISLSSSHDH